MGRVRDSGRMTERAFRFGVIAGQARTGAEWTATARRAEELGYDILLIPDTLFTLSPFAALAAAAAATSSLRVGTYVLNTANRTPAHVAWETRSLQTISDGRFELGVGGGRPNGQADTAALGGMWGTPADRLARTADVIAAARDLPIPPEVLVAASKPGMMRLAAEQADTVTFGLPPATTPTELFRAADAFRSMANRADQVELLVGVTAFAPTIFALPDWLSRQVGGDPQEMAASGAATFLIGDADHAAEELRRRRAEGGFSYFAVNGMFMEDFAPVLQRLRATDSVTA
ncbi:N5,N10-methylene tetrahydromethanopterin reductase [Actinoplanes ianthinogenes]|uniref:N5,N10-methylene tetrahydromethanopterin reductase n=2 Tax=Actinoplanes ianthinogenes TaxID=122358 RepID=A0ABM7LSB8_9ACTN|nr:N5,N10-methylene tetrahydromethanopterin reductase [Actinoplanes ianthinogenes]GGR37645.1 N5,N10-methylene tetrahydromethanopterin reductase [Actinoplanes ianthinogenes]